LQASASLDGVDEAHEAEAAVPARSS
jgi:hypothetical protein